MPSFARIAAAALFTAISSAQTWSDCNPTKVTGCPAKPGLTTDFTADFTQGGSAMTQFTTTSSSITNFDPVKGAEFKISKLGDGPTIQSNFMIFYGRVEVVMQAAPGAGIVSSWLLQSDDLDEIDWEFIGSHSSEGQSNYFGKGNTTTYDRGQTHTVSDTTSTFHTYTLDWNKDSIVWSVDGTPVRTTTYASAVGGQNFPQTPMNLRIGNWVAGDPKNNQGTIDWAGGVTDFSKGPFSMWVKSVKVTNYNPAQSYSYGDMTGSSASIKLIGAIAPDQGKKSSSSSNTPSSTPAPISSTPASVSSSPMSSPTSASPMPSSSNFASSAAPITSSSPLSSSVARSSSVSQSSLASSSSSSSSSTSPSQSPPSSTIVISSKASGSVASTGTSIASSGSSAQTTPALYSASTRSTVPSNSTSSSSLTTSTGKVSSFSSKVDASSSSMSSASPSSMPYSNGTVTSSMLSASATSTMIPGGLGFGKGNFTHPHMSGMPHDHSMSLDQPCTETTGMVTLTSTITIPNPADSTAAPTSSPSSSMSSPPSIANQGNSNAQASNPGGDVFGIAGASTPVAAAPTKGTSTLSGNTAQFTGAASQRTSSKTLVACAGMALVAGFMSLL